MTVFPQPLQDLHPASNALAALSNTYTTMTPSISATKKLPSDISVHTPILPDYDLDLSTSMLQQLELNW